MQVSVCVYNSLQDYERLPPNILITHRKRAFPIEPHGGLSDADGDLAKIARSSIDSAVFISDQPNHGPRIMPAYHRFT